MGRNTDRGTIQLKMLNASRAQCDRARYRAALKQTVETEAGLDIRRARRPLPPRGRSRRGRRGSDRDARSSSIGGGHDGNVPARSHLRRRRAPERGTAGEFAAIDLSAALARLGLTVGRLNAGTSPRLRQSTIDFGRSRNNGGRARSSPTGCSPPAPSTGCSSARATPTSGSRPTVTDGRASMRRSSGCARAASATLIGFPVREARCENISDRLGAALERRAPRGLSA